MRNFLSVWEGSAIEVDEYCALDDERVLVLLHRGGRGTTSRLEVAQMRTAGVGDVAGKCGDHPA
jgi:hypothetical protein